MLRKRWQFEEEQRLEKQNGSPVDCSNEQWDEDWRKIVELASTTKSSRTHSLNALEEIHIFVLANLLRRPILVLCDDVHRGNYNESLSDVNLGGVYLPLLCDSVDCVKSPLVIGYHQGHFMALVMTEDGSATGEDMFRLNKNAVPLVKYDGNPMQLHFLLPEELQCSDRLLREYLNCSKVEYTDNEVTRTIFVATMQPQEPEVHLHRMFKTYFGALQAVYLKKLADRQMSSSGQTYRSPSPSSSSCSEQYQNRKTEVVAQSNARCCSAHKRCKNAVCRYYASRTNDYCHQCRKSETQLCTSPGCSFAGNRDNDGLCSSCFAQYRALLEQGGTHMATPTAPPSYKCCNPNCRNEAGEYFSGKCHECYSKYIHNPNLQDWATSSSKTGGQRLMARPVKQAEKNLSVIGEPSTALPCQSSRLFCFNQMCNNPLEQSNDIYCETCSSSNSEQPGGINTVFKVCQVPGCNMPSVTYHGELCWKHAKESEGHDQSKRDQKFAKGKCINKGCQFFGIPENNYLCSQCHAKALQEEYDRQRVKAEQDRAQAEWLAQRASSEQRQFERLRKPFYYEVNLKSK